MIDSPLRFNLFRLPTDNDKTKTEQWDKAGFRNLNLTPGKWNVTRDGATVVLSIENRYSANENRTYNVSMKFTVDADGTIIFNSDIDPTVKDEILPKIGFRTEMPATYDRVQWFGRGPWESYLDRKEACFEGLYSGSVSGQTMQYVLPQESGNKEDVRWLALSSADGTGMIFIAPRLMSATVEDRRPEEQYTDRGHRAGHPYQVVPAGKTIVSLDAANRALGNASCGPDVLPKYELKSGKISFSLIMMPLSFSHSDTQLAAKARVTL